MGAPRVFTLSLLFLLSLTVTVMAQPIGYQAVPRDAFPVFDNPKMLTAEEAEREGVIYPRDVVIGMRHGQAAKAVSDHHHGGARAGQRYPRWHSHCGELVTPVSNGHRV
ncbi:MAG: hypothetical protein ETSY2_39750 [Candidatus Entotheonella gemina]|uniref:Uncharacterized protein n=1 Tax=Candidatus Entotheonella gemina TaxID=1429439 RepID=W4LQS2_9BACT|nr:MAG: hypothetical protein ETSY2_39750 [Candidatus Entotheonella gemina]